MFGVRPSITHSVPAKITDHKIDVEKGAYFVTPDKRQIVLDSFLASPDKSKPVDCRVIITWAYDVNVHYADRLLKFDINNPTAQPTVVSKFWAEGPQKKGTRLNAWAFSTVTRQDNFVFINFRSITKQTSPLTRQVPWPRGPGAGPYRR